MKSLPALPALPFLAAAILALGLVAAAPPHHSAPIVAGDTPGGFRFGSASAPIKLVEFGSLNCSHCAAFGLARSGKVLLRATTGMALGFAYFVADNFSLAMGNVGAYPPLMAAWAPFFLFLLIGETVLIQSEE